MSPKTFILYSYSSIFFQCFYSVLSQVCVETTMNYRDVPETYLYTYMEAYEKTGCLFWCTDTRVASAVATRIVQKLVPEQTNVCCEGYIKDENYNNNSIHCKPLCTPSCKNGYCKAPGVCACNPGYTNLYDPYVCSPLCTKGCDHGTCTAPDICECHEGYALENEECKPICSDPCYYGTCVAPETCQCHPGYKKSIYDTCEPHCSSYTDSGECVVTITCEPGWTKVFKGQFEECEPECTEPCINGECVSPNVCKCLGGYTKFDDECRPYCSVCDHGTCISPETCVCDPGWYTKEPKGTCLPHCDHKCGNGTCVAPNVCECLPGYKIDEKYLDVKDTICAPICNNCEGICVAPEQCVCESPQETLFVSADGEPCDCLSNCSDTSNRCERTQCLTATTTEFVTTFKSDEDFEEVPVATDMDTESGNQSDNNEPMIEKTSWFSSKWFYAVGSSIIVIILILMAAAILKRKYVNGNIFKMHNDNISSAVHYKQKESSC